MKSLITHAFVCVLAGLATLAWVDGKARWVPGNVSLAQTPAVPPPPVRVPGTSASPPSLVAPDTARELDPDEQVNTRVYALVNRCVVNITTESTAASFFGEETVSGGGSGFVIDRLGHVLTNYHVVESARAVQVNLFDGSSFQGEIVGVDPNTDVAVVKINAPAEKLNPVSLGDSTRLLVGQKILALGNPFGLERTLTTGIISSLDRSLKSLNNRTIRGIIQTDAAVNPGNSGGPLLNTRGQVIGMNTAIASRVGQSAGISFAVPINSIKRILAALIRDGRVTRADLGLSRVLTTERGLVVAGVVEGGPADQAGIQPMRVRLERFGAFVVRRPDIDSADLITAINGKLIHNVEELLTEVETHKPGDTVELTIQRAGQTLVVEVRLATS